MKISHYFADLRPIYVAEIEDLTTDSGGGDVLNARLKAKRSQISDLLPMMETNPEMLAVAFHKGMTVNNPKTIFRLLAKEPFEFPSWDSVSGSVEFEPWASDLVDMLHATEGGEQFLLTTVALEYLYSLSEASEHLPEERDSDDESDESDDLGEAGDQWLSDQGFDSHQ